MRHIIILFSLTFLISSITWSQQVSFADPEGQDSRKTNFDIIGKLGNHFLVFKNNRSENDICVYDTEMKLVERVKQSTGDGEWINADFITYANHAWMVYQYVRRNWVYCMAVKIDANGKRISDPIAIDTSRMSGNSTNKVYSFIYSDDKKQLMVFKINRRNSDRYIFTTLLFDPEMQLVKRDVLYMQMEERNDFFSDFYLDNLGNLVFGKFVKKPLYEEITDFVLIKKPREESSFVMNVIPLGDRDINDFNIKVDNNTKRYLFTALYAGPKKNSVIGLYTVGVDAVSDQITLSKDFVFNHELRLEVMGRESTEKTAFNDYKITHVITKKDGGYVWMAEAQYTTNRGNAYDRLGNRYWMNPMISPLDYYYLSPYVSPYGSFYWDRSFYGRSMQPTNTYHTDNLLIFSFDKNGQLEWKQVIPKSQFDEEQEALVSYQTMITGGEIHLLFNIMERRTLVLNEQSVSPNGLLTRHPTIKNQANGLEFLTRLGKQVSARSFLMPAFYRNNLTFAKIDY